MTLCIKERGKLMQAGRSQAGTKTWCGKTQDKKSFAEFYTETKRQTTGLSSSVLVPFV